MTIFFTSDMHFNHFNIMQYCNRPFTSVVEMNEGLIERHNRLVKPTDTVYDLGDFAMNGTYENVSSFMKRLNGKRHCLYGNHFKKKYFLQMVEEGIIESHQDVLGISINGTYIWLSHYPHLAWNRSNSGSWNIHGHTHSSKTNSGVPFRVDVGVDNFNYAPVSFDELMELNKQAKEQHEAIMAGVYV